MRPETLFWIAAAVMVAFAAVAVLLPLWRKSTGEAGDAELAREALASQMKVLTEERDAGLVTNEGFEACAEDIRRRALKELAGAAPAVSQLTAGARKLAAGIAALFVAAAGLALYMHLGSPSLIDFVSGPVQKGIMQPDGTLASTEGHYDEEALAAYLKDNKKDERAWVLYARMMTGKEEWQKAADAYANAVNLNGRVAADAEVLVEYAACLMSTRKEQNYRISLGVLDQALVINERLLTARELYAIASLELGNWTAARENLEVLLASLNINDPVYERLAQAASYAAQKEREEAAGNRK